MAAVPSTPLYVVVTTNSPCFGGNEPNPGVGECADGEGGDDGRYNACFRDSKCLLASS